MRHAVNSAPRVCAWRREAALAGAVFLLTAAVFTWPLAGNLTRAIPTGSRPPTVALFNLFTAEWTGLALEHGASYWDAPMFYPHRGTLAWSEPQPATSLAVWLISKVSGMVPAYNLVLLSFLTLTGLAGYAMTRQLTDDRLAALWAGLWATAGAYPISQLTVLQLLAGAFPVACLACILFLARRPRAWAAWTAGLAYFLTLMTCLQFGLMLTVLLPVFVIPLIDRKRWSWRRAVALAAPLPAALLLALPFLLTQREHLARMGFQRSWSDVTGAYTLSDLFLPARGHWLTSRMLHLTDVQGVYPSDIGVVLLACLCLAGACGGWRLRGVDPLRIRQRVSVLALSVVALLLGFGPQLGAPYAWLRSVVPGLDNVRTPARFGMFATVGLAALAAVGFAFLRRRSATPAPRLALTVAGFGLLLAEMWAVPIGLVDPQGSIEDHRAVLTWLGEQARGQPVLELPMAEGDGEAALEREVWAVRRALVHGSPVANGYSGYFPEPFLQLRDAIRTDLAGRGLRYIGALGLRYVLVHDHEYTAPAREALGAALGGELVLETGRDSLIRLDADRAAAPLSPSAAPRRFRNRPDTGTVLGFPLPPTNQARLILPDPGRSLQIAWPDRAGVLQTGSLRVRGSVLVDAGASTTYLFVQTPPGSHSPGEAVLFSEERLPR